MMKYCGFLLAGLWALANLAGASEAEPAEQLRTQVHDFLYATFLQQLPPGRPEDYLAIHVANLDARLNLPPCDRAPDISISSPQPYGSNITVRVTCTSGSRWSIYVPARIELYADIAVLTRNLGRGDVITAQDVQLLRMNTAQAGFGHIEELDRVVGMQLRRSLRSGETVRLSHLLVPEIIRRGDSVILEAQNGGLSVVMEGTALANGKVGEQIQVRNSTSQRVVEATIVGPGRVRVNF